MQSRAEAAVSKSDTRLEACPVVIVVDADPDMRETLQQLVATKGWRAELFGRAQDFLARRPEAGPSCLVLGVRLPDACGLALLERESACRGLTPVVFVDHDGDVSTAVRAMKAGAVDFLMKPCAEAALLQAISSAIERSQAAWQQANHAVAVRERYKTLSPRERQVMALVTAGLLNKQVGAELGITEVTVKAHRGQVMRKMNARSLAGLVEMSVLLGLERGHGQGACRAMPFTLQMDHRYLLREGPNVALASEALSSPTAIGPRVG